MIVKFGRTALMAAAGLSMALRRRQGRRPLADAMAQHPGHARRAGSLQGLREGVGQQARLRRHSGRRLRNGDPDQMGLGRPSRHSRVSSGRGRHGPLQSRAELGGSQQRSLREAVVDLRHRRSRCRRQGLRRHHHLPGNLGGLLQQEAARRSRPQTRDDLRRVEGAVRQSSPRRASPRCTRRAPRDGRWRSSRCSTRARSPRPIMSRR